jgi:hypothetical protein
VDVNYFYLRQPGEINVPAVSNLPHSGDAIISVTDPKHFRTDPDPEFDIKVVQIRSRFRILNCFQNV